MELGAQLYTVRDFTKTLKDFSETLQKIADIGYTTVQVSGTCAYTPEWLREELKKSDLRCVVTHTNPDRMVSETDLVAAEHKIFNCKNIGIGCMPGGLKGGMTDYIAFKQKFKLVGKRFSELGNYLMYHNHNMEFAKSDNGEVFLQRIADDFAPDELGFILDTYWVQAGGGDPAWWIGSLKGRVPCVHLKDMIYSDGIKMAAVGDGNINFDSVLKACESAGTEYLLVEQDECYGADPFDCLRRSYSNLKARGL